MSTFSFKITSSTGFSIGLKEFKKGLSTQEQMKMKSWSWNLRTGDISSSDSESTPYTTISFKIGDIVHMVVNKTKVAFKVNEEEGVLTAQNKEMAVQVIFSTPIL